MAQNTAGPGRLVTELAGLMKKESIVKPPQWAAFVKTGAHAQRPPANPDWWYIRAASILWQVYRRGPLGVGKLRGWYGGRKKRGTKPEAHYRAGGKVIRLCLQQLEASGLLAKEGAGRKVTPKGQAMVDKLSNSLRPRYEKKAPVEKAAKKPKPEAEGLAEAPAKKPRAKKPKSLTLAELDAGQRTSVMPSQRPVPEAPAEAAATAVTASPEAAVEKPKKRVKKAPAKEAPTTEGV